MSGFVLPDNRHRITIIGKTGSGKTQGAAWLLANRDYTTRPWVVLNWKRDELLSAIPGAHHLQVTDNPPKRPGVWLIEPDPADTDAVDAFLRKMWEQERIGLFVDEGYMIPMHSPSFQAILTQGRSKQLPVIMLTQRPAWVTRFAFSEADFIQLYQLTDTRDAKVVKQFMPLPIETPLPAPYYSWWWDNGNNHKAILKPVPSRDTILGRFYERLKPSRKAF